MKGTELADHIRDEMAKAGHDYIDMLGELMTEYLRRHPETEIDGKLTLKGASCCQRTCRPCISG